MATLTPEQKALLKSQERLLKFQQKAAAAWSQGYFLKVSDTGNVPVGKAYASGIVSALQSNPAGKHADRLDWVYVLDPALPLVGRSAAVNAVLMGQGRSLASMRHINAGNVKMMQGEIEQLKLRQVSKAAIPPSVDLNTLVMYSFNKDKNFPSKAHFGQVKFSATKKKSSSKKAASSGGKAASGSGSKKGKAKTPLDKRITKLDPGKYINVGAQGAPIQPVKGDKMRVVLVRGIPIGAMPDKAQAVRDALKDLGRLDLFAQWQADAAASQLQKKSTASGVLLTGVAPLSMPPMSVGPTSVYPVPGTYRAPSPTRPRSPRVGSLRSGLPPLGVSSLPLPPA